MTELAPRPLSRPTTLRSFAERAAPWLAIAAALLVTPESAGAAVHPLGHLFDPLQIGVVRLAQAGALLAGLALLWRRVRRAAPTWLLALVGAGGAVGVVLGLFGWARWLEWLPPPPRPLSELCAFVRDGYAPDVGRGWIRVAEARYAAQAEGWSLERRDAASSLAQVYLQHGRNQEAIEVLDAELERGREAGRPAGELAPLHRALGIAYLRVGETTHCIEHHVPGRCLFPIRDDGVWEDVGPARLAINHLRAALEVDPEDLVARWLLHLAHMAAGEEGGAPAPWRIDPFARVRRGEVAAFRDCAVALGVAPVDLAGGAVMEDLDGDGLLDLVCSTMDPCGRLRYFHNEGDGSFADWSARSRLGEVVGGLNLVQTDFDGDGRLDLMVLRGAWMLNWGRQANSLLRQNEDGTFTDVAPGTDLGDLAYPSLAAAWTDYDGDGDLDVFVGHESVAPGKPVRSMLFRNDGGGRFVEATRAAGIHVVGDVKGVAWGDYDGDGDPDLYVSDLHGPNSLWRNRGDGVFEDVAASSGVAHVPPGDHTFGCWFFDYDNDGRLDLFVAGYGAERLERWVADKLGRPSGAETLTLFRNDGRGGFRDVTDEVGLRRVEMPMGANFGDVDNDGWLDVYLGTGWPDLAYLVPNVLLRNAGGRFFEDVTVASRMGHLQKGHGIAFGDLDNDGDQDVYAQMGGFFPTDRFANALFENPGAPGGWVTLELRGTRAARTPLGARVRVAVERPDGSRREVFVTVGSGGSFGGSSLRQEVGLGDARRILEVGVRWPWSTTEQVFADVPMRRFVRVVEGEDRVSVLERRRVVLGGR